MDSRLVDILLNVSSIDTTKLVKYLAVNHPQILIDFDSASSAPEYHKVVQLMKSDHIVSAIKELRALTGFGLKDSKDCVDYARGCVYPLLITDAEVLRVAQALKAAYN